MRPLALLLAALVCSCSSSPPPVFRPSVTLAGDALEDADRAFKLWASVALEHARPRFGDEGAWTIELGEPPDGYDGWTDYDAHAVVIRPGGNTHRRTMHEVGHVLGIREHVESGVMQAKGGSSELSAQDRAACREVGSCP